MNINDDVIKFQKYDKAAVSSDNEYCSKISKDVLKRGGSAADAAIAAVFCAGVFQFHSTGIGGGGFMLVYERAKKKFTGFDFRETVPSNVDLKEFENNKRKTKIGVFTFVFSSLIKSLLTETILGTS